MSNAERARLADLWGVDDGPQYPKDGINDHVVNGAATVNPRATGTKAALWYKLELGAGATEQIALRLATGTSGPSVDDSWHGALAARSHEADDYYADLTPRAAAPGARSAPCSR